MQNSNSYFEKAIESIGSQLDHLVDRLTDPVQFDSLEFQRNILSLEKLGCSKINRSNVVFTLLSNAVAIKNFRIVAYISLYRLNAFTNVRAAQLQKPLFEMYKDDAYTALITMMEMRAGDSLSTLGVYIAVFGCFRADSVTHTCVVHFGGKLDSGLSGLILDIPFDSFEDRLKEDGVTL